MGQHLRNTLGKTERLKRRKHINALFADGKSFVAYPLKVYYAPCQPEPAIRQDISVEFAAVQIGVTVSKRFFKKAVDRNRIKRLLRECYRLNKHDLLQAASNQKICLQVFFIYLDKTLPDFVPLNEKMKYCLKRLIKAVEEEQ